MKLKFTSIAALRNSSAIQSRVTQVENNLIRLNPNWQSDWWFPVVAVGLSNALADVSWVSDNDEVLLDSSETIYIEDVTINSVALADKMSTGFGTAHSRADAEGKLSQVDGFLSELAGTPVSWKTGIKVGVATKTVATMEEDTDSTPEVSPADIAYDALKLLDIEDVLAVVLRVNADKGPLLKNSTAEEQQHFISVLTEDVTTGA